MKNKRILLSLYEFHTSSAAIAIDGKIVFACHEDRIIQKKNEIGFPLLSIKKCIKFACIQPEDIDEVIIVNDKDSFKNYNAIVNYLFKRQSRYSIDDWINENKNFWFKNIYENRKYKSYFKCMGGEKKVPNDHYIKTNFYDEKKSVEKNVISLFKEKILLVKRLGIKNAKINFVPHYKCHHYHAFYSSKQRNFNKSLILHCEGDGGKYNQAVSIPTLKGLKFIHGTNKFNLGRLYQWTTLNLNMKPYHDEYKVMGLSPYGDVQKSVKLSKILNKYFKVHKKKFVIEFKSKPKDMYYFFKKIYNNFRFDEVAGGLQHLIEKLLSEWVFKLTSKYRNRSEIFYGGGVAMNVKSNLAISKIKKIKKFFVPLSPADETNVLGALYMMIEKDYLQKNKSLKKIPSLSSPYLGMEYNSYNINSIKKYIGQGKVNILKLEKVAQDLNKGKIIARFSGRSEFGQRALGNRSILASPIYKNIQNKINYSIKSRDFWLPFGLTIIEEDENKYLIRNKFKSSPFMTTCYELKPKYYNFFTCGVHDKDNTVRAQILKKEVNNDYYRLIKELKKITKIGAIVNTSMNFHKYPIVETEEHALDFFKFSKIDGLILNEFYISK